MRKTRLWLATIATLLCSMMAKAGIMTYGYDFKTDGVYYRVTSDVTNTVAVSFYAYGPDGSFSGVYSGSITIPLTTTNNNKTYRVTSIGDDAFHDCSNLTSITIPESVTSIGERAFEDCSSLTSITIPESVTSIQYGAFLGCINLKTVINYSDLNIQKGSGDGGYVACYADIVVNADKLIGDYAFKTKDGVHYLTGYIGDATELTLPADYQGENYQIGERAFEDCSNLTSITLPESVTSIGDYAFYNCSSLTSITIPESVTSIGWFAFDDCSSLTAVHISSMEAWCNIAFTGFPYEGSNPLYDAHNLYLNGELVTELVIPDGVTEIGWLTFQGLTGIKKLSLGKGLKKIASGAFSGCEEIEKITIYAAQPPTTTGNIFSEEVYENTMLYVPQGSISKYQVMTGWSGFYNISEIEGGTPDYLTIRQADNGEVGIAVDLGRTYRVRIAASEGWKVHSVTFDGVDMTAQLDESYTFTTPTLTGSAVLNVAYEQVGVNKVVSVRSDAIKVRGYQDKLFISGTESGDHIAIYTVGGIVVAEVKTEGINTEISVESGQLYIVKVAGKVVKIQM